jgi:tRNA-2-methylthio-N6-dimethylallyladenosine synthase
VRTYFVSTFGCQMNAHDSERIKGMLESLGLGEARAQDEADVIVFNTCTVREKPDQRFRGAFRSGPRAQGARSGQGDRGRRVLRRGAAGKDLRALPGVDVAFGPGSISHLADWVGAGGDGISRGRFAEWNEFAADLPARRERRFQAWVQISMGCNSKCAYCIVPAVRGREQSRRPGDILAEVSALAREGVREITMLGQNVNSWGRDLAPDLRTEFGELLRALDDVEGNRPDPFHEPASEGLPRSGHRGHVRMRIGVRARPSPAAIGLDAHPEGNAADLSAASGISPSSTSSAPRFQTSR